jgi:hypothetical protein
VRDAGDLGAITVGDKTFRLATSVRAWPETGLHFATLRRRVRTDSLVLHWSGSELPAASVHASLQAWGLGVHFVIDALGVVWQMADADRQLSHTPGLNGRALGISLITRGNADPERVQSKGILRHRVTEQINGFEVTYDALTGGQVLSLVVLVTALCTIYGLPLRVPVDRDGKVIPYVLSQAELRGFRGVLGQLHASPGKSAPGLRILGTFARQGEDTE